jgi:predicted DCC family thiol-disulfide oxidoreductase YuxK
MEIVQRAPYDYRADPGVPRFADDLPIVVFDRECVLCSRFVQFILRHDRNGRFRLLAAQSPIGTALYRHFGLDPIQFGTYILLQDGRTYLRSEASIRILQGLGSPWQLAALARIFPRPLRDAFYNFVARNRLRWFGTRPTCYTPDPSQADRFIS